MAAQIKLILFGDSFTICPGLADGERWPRLVAAALAARFAGQVDLAVTESAVVGDTTRTALERMQKDVQFARPDVLAIQFGFNDSTYWKSNLGVPIVSLGAYRANLLEMIERARVFGTRRIVLVTNHRFAKRRYDINGKTPGENLDAYDETTRAVAAEAGCRLADVHAALKGLDPASYCIPAPDEFHVAASGAAVYAEVVGAALSHAVASLIEA
jgi:lysophospholipase L1-like esterase